jgi:hypothetical protein
LNPKDGDQLLYHQVTPLGAAKKNVHFIYPISFKTLQKTSFLKFDILL